MAALSLALPAVAVGQAAELRAPAADSATTVAILTIGPGAEVWERWGHNTIVVTDNTTHRSNSYNWGLFNFRQEDFLLRFARGTMRYSMGSRRTDRDLALYASRDRSMLLQPLALTPTQVDSLRRFLNWNNTEENRYYHYNYYLDNCSTRVRDAIDRVLGGQLQARFDTVPSGHTWRWETRRIVGWDLPLYVGVGLALGHPVDAEMSAWQSMFLPLRLQQYLATAEVTDASGAVRKLVQGEEPLQGSSRFTEAEAPAPTWLVLVPFGVLVGALLVWLGTAGLTARWARRTFGLLASVWSLVAGLGGILLLFLWFFTDHWSSHQNENVLLLTPISLALVVLVPLALRGGMKSVRAARTVALVVAGLALLALVAKVLPAFRQYNLEMIGMILPIHLGLFLGLDRATRVP